jgi:hypothetical protein
MGRQYSVEEEKDLTLPEDSIHRARLVEIKEREFTFTDRNNGQQKTGTNLEWWFEVTVPQAGLDTDYIGRRVKGECRPKITNRPGNRFREWSEALLGRDIPVGMVIDTDDLLGLEAEICIGHRQDRKDPAKVWEEVTGVIPVTGQSEKPPF